MNYIETSSKVQKHFCSISTKISFILSLMNSTKNPLTCKFHNIIKTHKGVINKRYDNSIARTEKRIHMWLRFAPQESVYVIKNKNQLQVRF